MPELKINANKSARILYASDGVAPGTNYSGEAYATELYNGALLLGFPLPSGIGTKAITGLSFSAFVIPYVHHDPYLGKDDVYPVQLAGSSIESKWDESKVTWNTQPSRTANVLYTSGSNLKTGMYVNSYYDVTRLDYIKSILTYGLHLKATSYEVLGAAYAQVATNHAEAERVPYIVLTYDDEDVHLTISSVSPVSGNYPRVADTRFAWSVRASGASLDPVTLANATFRWRPAGETAYTEIDCGTRLSYTVPANTFTTASIQWQVVIEDSGGHVTTSDWYTIDTSDVEYSCEIVSPKSEIVDGSQAIPIQFKVYNSTGQTPQSLRFDFYGNDGIWRGWTVSGSDWSDWRVSGVTRTWTMPRDSHMPIGEMQVRMYVNNTDGAAGSVATTTFLRLSAPDAPSVSVEAVPRAVVRWQASGQVAYRVTLDGTVYGPYFGTTNAFTSPELLPDGQHTAVVEVQGEYGLWSEPGSYSFAVENQPVGTLLLDGSFGLDAYLSLAASWSGPYDFWIYRDGKRIARTGAELYTDRLALGEHEYQVFAVFASGNYTASNRVTGTPVCQSMAITPAEEESVWLMLETSASSDRAESYSYSKTHSLRHFLGAEYPVLEESTFADLSGSFEAAFMDKDQADAFWALRGKVVILKARDEAMVGLLANVRKTRTHYLHSFSFELQQIDWEGLDA